MKKNLQGELTIMDTLDIKPNYAALARKYGLDWRTVKKYHEGYIGKPTTRNKKSKLDSYQDEIKDKLQINRITVRGVYEFMVSKYGIAQIGSYQNFNKYIIKHNLRVLTDKQGNPRYEKGPGEQAQVDWKENISIANKYGEIFTINILHVLLKFSRFSYLELSLHKRFDDLSRGLVNAFKKFNGVPEELLFDNMSTVANVNTKPKKPTTAISTMGKDFNFKIKLCKSRKPETKGGVEARNKILDWIRPYEGEFETLQELIEIVGKIAEDMNTQIHQETNMSPTALFYKEKEYLQTLPNKEIIDNYLTPNKYKVSNEGLIRYEKSKYSVDPKLIGEEVTVDLLDNKLYIYYIGKLITIHSLSENPINYKEEHYKEMMTGKVQETEMKTIVTQNLAMMDNILSIREVKVSGIEATKSAEALITYINQSQYGKWVINYYTHLSAVEKLEFIKGMNEVLPYVVNTEKFIANIKFSMKENLCRYIAFDCLVNDFMAVSEEDTILSDEGYEYLKNKYSTEIEEFINDLTKEQEGSYECV